MIGGMLFESIVIKLDQTLISEITQIEEETVRNILITKLDTFNIYKLKTHSTQLRARASPNNYIERNSTNNDEELMWYFQAIL